MNSYRINKAIVISCISISLFYLCYILTQTKLTSTFNSDGDGYYGFLPALWLQKDPTFKETFKARKEQTGLTSDYVIPFDEKHVTNKFFGGSSLIATPAFLAITAYVKLSGEVPNGYNNAYQVGMLIYSYLLFLVGFIIYYSSITRLYKLNDRQQLIFIPLVFITPWLFASLYGAMFANNLLFFCFALALHLTLAFKDNPLKRVNLYALFFMIGVIGITRPTSLLFVLMIPYFFDNWKSFITFLKQHILNTKTLAIGVFLLSIPLVYQLGLWKWQTGHWIVYSYSGEGFNWFKPAWKELFFGYRNGILFTSPILFIALILALQKWKKSPFKSSIYLLFFLAVCYISSAWWCYDFETNYGLRNFYEFYVFLLFPIFESIKENRLNWLKVGLIMLITFLSILRFNQFVLGYNINQRFTANSYWKSISGFTSKNKNRWQFSNSARPYGKLIFSDTLLNNATIDFNSNDEFYSTIRAAVSLKKGERLYIQIELQRSGISGDLSPLFILDYRDSNHVEHNKYVSYSMYEDKLADEEEVIIKYFVMDYSERCNEALMYFWNQNNQTGTFKNATVILEKYSSI